MLVGTWSWTRDYALTGTTEEREPRRRATIAAVAKRRALVDVLGAPVFLDVTDLPRAGGGGHGRLVHRGAVMVWSLWAPHRNLLLDVWSREMPPDDELRAREAWADERQIKYRYVPPDRGLELADLERLAGRAE